MLCICGYKIKSLIFHNRHLTLQQVELTRTHRVVTMTSFELLIAFLCVVAATTANPIFLNRRQDDPTCDMNGTSSDCTRWFLTFLSARYSMCRGYHWRSRKCSGVH